MFQRRWRLKFKAAVLDNYLWCVWCEMLKCRTNTRTHHWNSFEGWKKGKNNGETIENAGSNFMLQQYSLILQSAFYWVQWGKILQNVHVFPLSELHTNDADLQTGTKAWLYPWNGLSSRGLDFSSNSGRILV